MINKYHFSLMFLLLSGVSIRPSIEVSTSGIFHIANDTTYTPTIPNDAIFKVLTNNVTLDFANHSITQATGNLLPGLDAILIGTGVSSFTIKNAIIQNISGIGIHAYDGCKNITILDSTVQGCNGAGIYLEGLSSGTTIKDCVISACKISTCTGAAGAPAYGIRLLQCYGIQIEGCATIFNDASTTTSGYGMYMENCAACVVQKSSTMFNGGTGIVAGIALITSYTCLLTEITAFNNINRDFGSSGTSCGVLLDKASSVICSGCTSNGNRNSKSSSFGFLTQTGQENIFQECVAERNNGGSTAAGFELSGEKKSSVIDCKSKNQVTTTSGTAYGIFLNNDCDKCYVRGNTLANNIGASSSFGIKDSRSESTSAIITNYAFNNGTNYSVTYPLTITLPVLTASLSSAVPGIPSGVAGIFDNISVNP